MSRRQIVSLFLVLLLLGGILSGCGGAPASQTEPAASAAETTENTSAIPTAEASTEADPDLPSISWSTAFHDSSVPEGTLTADCVAFLRKSGDGSVQIDNVPRQEVCANQPERLPRTHFFEQYMPQELNDELLPILDYAVANGYSRFCFPATSVTYSMVKQSTRYLSYTYDINSQSRIDPLTIRRFPQEDGELNFLMITICGMEKGNTIELYREGLAAAKAIVDAIPEGLDEQGKMLYLYRYLTDNVVYDDDNYYANRDWCLLYDTLVLHSTVCAGYAEALYVLCNLAGIECFNVTGEVGELLLSSGLHVWNVARINGQYYEFDATWDTGCLPSEYSYYGMSEAYSQANHTRNMRAFDQEFCPPRPEELLPEIVYPNSFEDPTYSIFWYYKIFNAKNAAPEKLLTYVGYDEDSILDRDPKDGWVTTVVPMSELCRILANVLSDEQVAQLLTLDFRPDEKGNLTYRVPEKELPLLRLVGVEENENGSWTASLIEIAPDGSLTPRQDTVTLTKSHGYYLVADIQPAE